VLLNPRNGVPKLRAIAWSATFAPDGANVSNMDQVAGERQVCSACNAAETPLITAPHAPIAGWR
jgi:hypothetical protein